MVKGNAIAAMIEMRVDGANLSTVQLPSTSPPRKRKLRILSSLSPLSYVQRCVFSFVRSRQTRHGLPMTQ